jgi:16S rRNA (uracil1498-N3)-methyltransferase
MTRRYFLPDLPESGGGVMLPDSEAQHAIRVMRVQVGDELELFDGKGHQCRATVTETGRNRCQCHADPVESVNREPTISVDLGIALPKPDRSRELIERLTELGVRCVTPLITTRTQRPPSDSLLEKLTRSVVEACKQCGRNHLMEIRSPALANEFFATADYGTKLIAHPSSDAVSLGSVVTEAWDSQDNSFVVAVGPEGGWTEEEIQSARGHGFTPVGLGRRIYRIETAAVVIAAVLLIQECPDA